MQHTQPLLRNLRNCVHLTSPSLQAAGETGVVHAFMSYERGASAFSLDFAAGHEFKDAFFGAMGAAPTSSSSRSPP
jgi:hypothetical protein